MDDPYGTGPIASDETCPLCNTRKVRGGYCYNCQRWV